jgi:DNA-binding CsgD family transcriptional regulator
MNAMDSSNRLERLLVAILLQSMKGTSLKEKVNLLNVAGFSNIEIANLLETSPQVVTNYLYDIRKSKKSKK